MTHGDASRIKCPACKKNIDRPLSGDDPQYGSIKEKAIHCPHCHCELYLWARWSITVDAERGSKAK